MAITGCPRRLLPSITRLGESNGTKVGGSHFLVLRRKDMTRRFSPAVGVCSSAISLPLRRIPLRKIRCQQ
jgi:hypothetical protein